MVKQLVYRRVIIKIGTNVITNQNGLLDTKLMERLVADIAKLKKSGCEVILVSSGAMGAGRSLVSLPTKIDAVSKRQVFAAVGQAELMHRYLTMFAKHKLVCAQALVTKEDFAGRSHYCNMQRCLESLLNEQIIPIFNENDVVSVSEIMFTDNDELAGLIASLTDADAVLFLTTVAGVQVGEKIITQIKLGDNSWRKHISTEKSLFGRGGMITKCKVAKRLAQVGITTHIVNGQTPQIIKQVMAGQTVGTKFVPGRKIAATKRWVAQSSGIEKGVILVNSCTEDMFIKNEVFSLLPIGITKIKGDFKKGDIVQIVAENGQELALGKAQYGSTKARTVLGKKNQQPLVHYDYLFSYV